MDTDTSPTSAVARLLSVEDILLDLDATSKKRLFEEVARLFEQRHGLDPTMVIESLSAREKLGSTGLGQGVAIPHARVKGLHHAIAAFVRLRSAIAFDAPDGKPVSELFVLLVPEQATEEHLQMLAEIAQMFCDKRFRELLRAAADPRAVLLLFAQWQP
jgi:PTS system nitrogen regulatory IIA component